MPKIRFALVYAVLLAAATCFAQSVQLNLPRDSQRASVSQRVGITDITINYHRPLVKGRTIQSALTAKPSTRAPTACT